MVKRGDTLWKISKKYGVAVKDIMKANRLSSPNKIKIGQSIVIPGSRRTMKVTTSRSKTSFSWPTNGEVINYFGENINNLANKGVNIRTNKEEDVRAAYGGEIVFANYLKGWGDTVIVEHPDRFHTIYANLKSISIKEGKKIRKNDLMGKVAPTSKGNYILHFEIRKQNIPQDPLQYLR